MGPAFIITWRGTWQNADELFDNVIFKGDFHWSAICSLAIGIMFCVFLMLFQHEIKAFALSGGR